MSQEYLSAMVKEIDADCDGAIDFHEVNLYLGQTLCDNCSSEFWRSFV